MIEDFGTTPDGDTVHRLTLGSTGPLTVKLLNLGAILQDVRLAGVPHALTLGTDTLTPYVGDMAIFGSLAGPVINRISDARTMIDGQEHRFEVNYDGGHTLHSGAAGTQFKLWNVAEHSPDHARLTLHLPDGEGGFPGNREISAVFSVSEGTLSLEITATSDATTILNIANHSYWNLDGSDTTRHHTLRLAADKVLEPAEYTLPTGRILDVANTRLDFRTAKPLPAAPEAQLDHNFCLAPARRAPTFAAELTGASGVTMQIETTEPGLQVYDGAGLSGPGRDGATHQPYSGVALEAQGWPNATNQPSFPSTTLTPGETYHQITRWHFAVA